MLKPLIRLFDKASLGLLDTEDSVGYRIAEIERHMHSWDRRFGKAVTPSGDTHVADLLGPGVTAFQITTGNNTWGNWVQVLGSSDTPQIAGATRYDHHRIVVEAASYSGTYFIQVAFGESADLAAKITAKTYTSHMYMGQSATVKTDSSPIQVRRQSAGTKAWFRAMVNGQNAKTLDFYIGLHEYEG